MKKDPNLPPNWQLSILFISGVLPWRFYLQEVATLQPNDIHLFPCSWPRSLPLSRGISPGEEGFLELLVFRQISLPYLCFWGLEFCRTNCVWCDFSPKCSSESMCTGEMEDVCNDCGYLAVTDTSSPGLFLLYTRAGSLQGKCPHRQKGMDVSSCSIAAPRSEVPGGNWEALIMFSWEKMYSRYSEVHWQTHPVLRQRGKGTQLDVLKVGPIPRFHPSKLSCSSASVNLGIAAWKSLLDRSYFLAVEKEHPLVLRASSDGAQCLCHSWLTRALSQTWENRNPSLSQPEGLFQETRAPSCFL